MRSKIDLHTHSTAADGTLSPSELVRHAKKLGITVLSLTDHDSVGGLDEFFAECERQEIKAVSGVELSAKYASEMHILGYFMDYKDENFARKLRALQTSRTDRNVAMTKVLREHGFDITDGDLTSQKDGGTLENTGRAHMAIAMVKKGYVKTTQEAFDKYLGKGKECYVPRLSYRPAECIEMIKSAGGLAVLAHPVYIAKTEDELKELLGKLKEYGLDGAECYYSDYTADYVKTCLKVCAELDLIPTGGSDFHGGNRPGVDIGDTNGAPLGILEGMKERLQRQ